MFWYIACLIPIIATIIMYRKFREEFHTRRSEPAMLAVLMGLVIFMFTGICLIPVSFHYDENCDIINDQLVSTPIASLRTQEATTLQGHFFLGSGNISGGSQERYYFMYDLGSHTYQRGWVNSTDTVLQETDLIPPQFHYHKVTLMNTKGYFWWPKSFRRVFEEDRRYTLVVPRNTIVQHFQVD